MRRFGVAAVTAVLVLGTMTVPVAAQEQPVGSVACPDGAPPASFEDVSDQNVHRPAIDCGAHLGIIHGRTATTYAPASPVTRAQLASLVTRTLDELHVPLPDASQASGFDDVGGTHANAIHRLAAAGIVRGTSDTTFNPSGTLTRAQLATILVQTLEFVRAEAITPLQRDHFSDVDRDSTHGQNIDAAKEEGLLEGRGDGRFDPTGTTRRDQIATGVIRFLEAATGDVRGEVWVLDQGTDRIHIYDGRTHEEKRTYIDVSPQALRDAGFDAAPASAVTIPHMIEFDSRERFAFVAATAGAVTLVIDARSKQVVEVLPTGGGSHMAAVTPDDSAVWVAAIGARQMVEIPLDLDVNEPTFAIGRRLDVADLLAPVEAANDWQFPSYSPVCHQYSPDSTEAWVTLGPAWNQGGLFVLDLEAGTVSHAYDPQVVKANCGVAVSDRQVLANWSGRVGPGEDTDGEWYVFDLASKDHLHTFSAEGFDAHGLRATRDGSAYWMVNRISDNALVVDAETLEVTARYPDIADTPDILDFSADDSLIYITQRGPHPRSGGVHAASGDNPGVAVVDTSNGRRVDFLEPAEVREAPSAEHPDGRILNDIHGIAYRVRGRAPLTTQDATADRGVEVVPARSAGELATFWCDLTV